MYVEVPGAHMTLTRGGVLEVGFVSVRGSRVRRESEGDVELAEVSASAWEFRVRGASGLMGRRIVRWVGKDGVVE